MSDELHFTNRRIRELWTLLRREAPREIPVYLVGGAVRDLLRGSPVHDLDLVINGEVRRLAHRMANLIDGDFYVLDEGRDTVRVIDRAGDGAPVYLDFCTLRVPDLETDLRERDFTINAIAVDLHDPRHLIDPTGGVADLRAGLLRACTPQSFENDPVRVLRGVRLSLSLGLHIPPETLAWMRAAAPLLPRVSNERQRDEFFRMLAGSQIASTMRLLAAVGIIPVLLPELTGLSGVEQSPPHTLDVWEHTLALLSDLERLWAVLVAPPVADAGANLWMGMALVTLGRFRPALFEHFSAVLNPNRSLRELLFFGALYHDAAKPNTRSVEPGGRVRFLRHEEQGAELVVVRARHLALSQVEIKRLKSIVRQHMRIHLLAGERTAPTRRAIYRFFRDAGPAGVDIALLSLADTLATYGPSLTQPVWQAELETARILLEAWFEQPAQAVSPVRLLTGADLMAEFGLAPGPAVGRLLDALREVQAAGEITTRAEAVAYLRDNLTAILGTPASQ
jgi:tRNA nucleotidyltransferase/poly(A) polymerase